MNILELIEKRYALVFGGNVIDQMMVDASKSKDKTVAVILTENELTKYHGVFCKPFLQKVAK